MFCIVYTLVFLLRVILLHRHTLGVMCDLAFQSSLSEYQHLLPKLEVLQSLITLLAFCETDDLSFFLFLILGGEGNKRQITDEYCRQTVKWNTFFSSAFWDTVTLLVATDPSVCHISRSLFVNCIMLFSIKWVSLKTLSSFLLIILWNDVIQGDQWHHGFSSYTPWTTMSFIVLTPQSCFFRGRCSKTPVTFSLYTYAVNVFWEWRVTVARDMK